MSATPPQPGTPPGAGPGSHLLLGGVAHLAEPAGRGVPLQRRPGDAVMDVVGAQSPLPLPAGHGSARTVRTVTPITPPGRAPTAALPGPRATRRWRRPSRFRADAKTS